MGSCLEISDLLSEGVDLVLESSSVLNFLVEGLLIGVSGLLETSDFLVKSGQCSLMLSEILLE